MEKILNFIGPSLWLIVTMYVVRIERRITRLETKMSIICKNLRGEKDDF